MGYKDYRKMWLFEVEATPEQCEQVFTNVFNSGKSARARGFGPKSRADFTVHRVNDEDAGEHLVAVFHRLRGFQAVALKAVEVGIDIAMESEGPSAAANARGNQIAFRARSSDEPGITRCEMWAMNYVPALGDTYKLFMKEVELQLRALDSGMRTARVKG
jgi:hypothetical protein